MLLFLVDLLQRNSLSESIIVNPSELNFVRGTCAFSKLYAS